MEVIATNVPWNVNGEALEREFRKYLYPLGCYAYRCEKLINRQKTNIARCGVAKLTLPSRELGDRFLRQHGDRAAAYGEFHAHTQIIIGGRDLHLAEANGPHIMDRFTVQALQAEQRKIIAKRQRPQRPRPRSQKNLQREYPLLAFSVGVWSYKADDLVFTRHLEERRSCKITFGRSDIRIRQFKGTGLARFHIIILPYTTVESITRDLDTPATITITVSEPPRTFISDDLINTRESFSASSRDMKDYRRVTGISDLHGAIVSTCLVYRCYLEHDGDLENIRSIEQIRALPKLLDSTSRTVEPSLDESLGVTQLQQDISNYNLPFAVAFQLLKLMQYGRIQPHHLCRLMPTVASQVDRKGPVAVENALRDINHTLPMAGPELAADGFLELSAEGLKAKLREAEYSYGDHQTAREQLEQRHEQLCRIYKAVITPTAILLHGPELETKNRVLRIYEPYIEHFLRVQFRDESGEQLRYDPQVSLEDIHEERFKGVLRRGITIAGRHFEFLGFSHSSLRNQSCWFLSPFRLLDGQLITARAVIADLGDFSEIRVPAKCAARIGQAFSETIMSIPLDDCTVLLATDVQRRGRTFSDGVGTISGDLWERILDQRPAWRKLRPTVFQIRYAGAKGMVSLDTSLRGVQMRLRPSMIKFEGGRDSKLEICEAGEKPADLFLNRPLIKLLEDLGVRDAVILKLQAKAIEDLRKVTSSPENAVTFLRREGVGLNAGLDTLLQMLKDLDVSYLEDPFLRDIVELVILKKLRMLKYKARIPVPQGVTLFGIMDETNYLREGEVFIPTPRRDSTGKPTGGIIRGRVLVSRSPSLHPGDLQVATAITPPQDSSLRKLQHCIVFSQQGQRDLPSKLGGGDLDGDKYDIIYDPEFELRIGAQAAAQYPPIVPRALDRLVMTEDMTSFFIDFMRTDMLPVIATQHLMLADQVGVRDVACIKLAELHSNAVDFSKSGVPPDMSGLNWVTTRPDFMAASPRLLYDNGLRHEDDSENEEEDAAADGDSTEPGRAGKRQRFYESKKVLGQLFRNIDEKTFIDQLREGSYEVNSSPLGLVPEIWQKIRPQTEGRYDYHRYQKEAMEIKQIYEDHLIDLMAAYSSKPWADKISEVEVVTGNILGRDGMKQTRQQEENSKTVKQRYDEVVEDAKEMILGPRHERYDDLLPRALACLSTAVKYPRRVPGAGFLRSFSWMSVHLCLHEMEKESGRRVREWGAMAARKAAATPSILPAATIPDSQGSGEGSSQSTVRAVNPAQQQESPVSIRSISPVTEPGPVPATKGDLRDSYRHLPRSSRPSPAHSCSRSSSARSTPSLNDRSSNSSSRRSRTAPSPLSEPASSPEHYSKPAPAIVTPSVANKTTTNQASTKIRAAAAVADEDSPWPRKYSIQSSLDQLALPDIPITYLQNFANLVHSQPSSSSVLDGSQDFERASPHPPLAPAQTPAAAPPLTPVKIESSHTERYGPSFGQRRRSSRSSTATAVALKGSCTPSPARTRAGPVTAVYSALAGKVGAEERRVSRTGVETGGKGAEGVNGGKGMGILGSRTTTAAFGGVKEGTSRESPIMIDDHTTIEELEQLAKLRADRMSVSWEVADDDD